MKKLIKIGFVLASLLTANIQSQVYFDLLPQTDPVPASFKRNIVDFQGKIFSYSTLYKYFTPKFIYADTSNGNCVNYFSKENHLGSKIIKYRVLYHFVLNEPENLNKQIKHKMKEIIGKIDFRYKNTLCGILLSNSMVDPKSNYYDYRQTLFHQSELVKIQNEAKNFSSAEIQTTLFDIMAVVSSSLRVLAKFCGPESFLEIRLVDIMENNWLSWCNVIRVYSNRIIFSDYGYVKSPPEPKETKEVRHYIPESECETRYIN